MTLYVKATDDAPVEVLGHFPTETSLNQVLLGWEWAAAARLALDWVRDRVAGRGTAPLEEDGYQGFHAGDALVFVHRGSKWYAIDAPESTWSGYVRRRALIPPQPSRYEWGYGGTGPSNLAIDLLADHLEAEPPPDVLALFHQEIMREWHQGEPFALPARELDAWLSRTYPIERRRLDRMHALEQVIEAARWQLQSLQRDSGRSGNAEATP